MTKPAIEVVLNKTKPPKKNGKYRREYDTFEMQKEVTKLLRTLNQYQGFIISGIPDSVAYRMVHNIRRKIGGVKLQSQVLEPGVIRFWITSR